MIGVLLAALRVAAVVAALTALLLVAVAATERFRYASNLVGFAVPAVLGTAAAATFCFIMSPRWWVVTWLLCAAAAAWTALEHVTRTYPRRALTHLLRQRLSTVLGPDWAGQVSVAFDDANHATAVTTTLPAKLIPSDITPRVRTVLSETLTGSWAISSRGLTLQAVRKVVAADTPALKNLKDIVLGPKAFTAQSRIHAHATNPDSGKITGFTVKYPPDIAADLALGQRRRRIEKLVREGLEAGEGTWVFDWKDSVNRLCEVRLSVFKPKIYHEPNPAQRFTTRAEAIENYPHIRLPLGVDEFGQRVEWALVGAATPHGVVYGASGAGKTSQVHTVGTGAAAAGVCVIVADFKCDREYDGFRDRPNFHLVAQDTYSCLRAISYVEELMEQRKSGGKAPKHAPAAGVPILFIVDEFAVFTTKLRDEIWPQFRKADSGLPATPPSITSMGAIYREGRSMGIHVLSLIQRATANLFDAEFKHNSPLRIQVGPADGITSQNFWDDYDIGQTIPAQTPGRALIKGASGFVPYQGFYTPDPAKSLSAADEACLRRLMPASRLYERALFDMPDASTIDHWDQIASAPLVSAADRPDLDPLSEHYNARRRIRRDTISEVIDATSMQFKPST